MCVLHHCVALLCYSHICTVRGLGFSLQKIVLNLLNGGTCCREIGRHGVLTVVVQLSVRFVCVNCTIVLPSCVIPIYARSADLDLVCRNCAEPTLSWYLLS